MIRNLKILLVEDDPTTQLGVSALIKDFACDCYVIGSGSKAATLSKGYDLIFMDLGLPDISGVEAARRIRRMGVKAPIIALTAHGTESNRRNCMKAGMNDFLNKPLEKKTFEKLLDKYFCL